MSTIFIGAQRLSCCAKPAFDETFPQSLDAYMSREEFHASITRINKVYRAGASKLVKFFIVLLPLLGLVLTIAGFVSARHHFKHHSHHYDHDNDDNDDPYTEPYHHGKHGGKKHFRMMMIGNIMLIAGLFIWVLSIIYWNIKRRRLTKQQCQYETNIYAMRSPACSWRFNDATRGQHHILIDTSSVALAQIVTSSPSEGVSVIASAPPRAPQPSPIVAIPVAAPALQPVQQVVMPARYAPIPLQNYSQVSAVGSINSLYPQFARVPSASPVSPQLGQAQFAPVNPPRNLYDYQPLNQ